MANLGFFELTLFGIIALIVLGPEKLPMTARTLGKWYGKFRRMSARLQSELVSELELTEVQEALQAEINEIRASEARMKAQMQELQRQFNKTNQQVKENTQVIISDWQHDEGKPLTKPLNHHFFLLGDYDKKRRLPPPPFLPNHEADKLLYQNT